MKPRLETSKKWTQFPKEYVDQIEQAFQQAFAAQLTVGKLIIEGKIFPSEIMLRVGYLENGRLRQANFEVSTNYSHEKKDALDRIYNCIDAAASMMNEYFESEGEVDFPLTWKEYDFSGERIWVQYSTVNSNLEKAADEILGVVGESLVVEESESEDALARASEKLEGEGEDDEYDDESTDIIEDDQDQDEENTEEKDQKVTPKIFTPAGKKKKEDLH